MTSRSASPGSLLPPISIWLVLAVVGGCAGPSMREPTAGQPTARATPAPAALPTATPGSFIETSSPTAAPLRAPSSWSPSPAGAPSPSATSTAPPTPAPSTLDPPASPGRFAIDLYRRGDFVSQATVEWCVPASILTMMNVIDGRGATPRRPSQRALNRISRSLSSPRLVGPGSEPEGWAGTLNRLDYGPYAVVAKRTRGQALATAARAIRLTGRPVGMLVWRGAHAWVMTGFEATADPAWTDTFRVTSVRISDPWYPRARASWGRPPSPDAKIRVADLAEVFLRWRRPLARYAELDGRYVLVLPVAPRVASSTVDPYHPGAVSVRHRAGMTPEDRERPRGVRAGIML